MKSLLESLRSQASKTFESCADKVQALLEKASDDVTSRVRRLEVSDRDNDGVGMGAKAKSKSMQQQKEEQLARRRALADARTEVGLLGQLIRLADYMMVGALMSMAIDSSADMLSTLVLPRDKGDKGVFYCALSIVPGDIEFSPLEEEVVAFMDLFLENMLNTVQCVQRILYLSALKHHFDDKVTHVRTHTHTHTYANTKTQR